MKFNLFGNKNYLKTERENYVKEFRVNSEIKITPCSKFVACMEKLSRNYVLALKDHNTTETLQVANKSDVEFYEGYEFSPEYTDSVRRNLSRSAYALYMLFVKIIEGINYLENKVDIDKKQLLNDIKIDISALNNIILNIYQHLTMTNDVPVIENNQDIPSSIDGLLKYIKELILKAIEELINLSQGLIIDYISKQLDIIINKLITYLEKLDNL